MNKIILSGNLTKDVELRYTPSGKAFARVGIGVSRKVKNSDGKYDSDFFNLVAWDKTAEFFGRYLAKGSKVLNFEELVQGIISYLKSFCKTIVFQLSCCSAMRTFYRFATFLMWNIKIKLKVNFFNHRFRLLSVKII